MADVSDSQPRVLLRLLIATATLFAAVNGTARAETTLRIGTTTMPPSIGNPYRYTGSPHLFTVTSMFDGLTRIDENGKVVPWLALEWTNIDPLTWRMKLRPNVKFSNGAPFNADAVIAVVNFFRSPDAAKELVAREMNFLKSARKLDDLTVDLITSAPTPHLPRTLSMLAMVEPTTFAKLGADAYWQAPIGTGPFVLDKPDSTGWKMSAFKGSWRAPKVDKLNWIAAPEASTRVQAVLANQMDIALLIGPDEVAAIEAGGGKGVKWRNAAVWALHFHQYQRTGPLTDRRVRQALNMAIDRQALVDGLMGGATVPANQPGPKSAYGYNPGLPQIPYDPAAARKLLAEAGYPKGFKFVMQGVTGAGPADATMFQIVAQNLAAIGVTMEIRQFPVSELLRAAVEGNWNGDGFGLTYSSEPTIDVLRTINSHSCLWAKPWYCNERIMPTIRAAQTEFDPVKARSLRHEIMRFYHDEYVSLFLYELPRFAGLRAGIDGFRELHSFINFEQIRKK